MKIWYDHLAQWLVLTASLAQSGITWVGVSTKECLSRPGWPMSQRMGDYFDGVN